MLGVRNCTKPKPRWWPVARCVGRDTQSTVPYAEKVRRSASLPDARGMHSWRTPRGGRERYCLRTAARSEW